MAIQVLEEKTLASLRTAVSNDPEGLTDSAWLDDDTPLPSGDGGIRALDLRTRHLSRWLYPATPTCINWCVPPAAACSRRFGHITGQDGAGCRHIRLMDARTKTDRALYLPSPAARDTYAVDEGAGTRHLLLTDVSDAVRR